MTNLIQGFRNISNEPINFTPCRLVTSSKFRSTAMPWRRRYAFTSTHGVTFHRTCHHQHRSDTFTSRFITAVHMTSRNTCCDRQVQCTDRVAVSSAVCCSRHQLSPSGGEETPGDCFADVPTSLSCDLPFDDNYKPFSKDIISYVSIARTARFTNFRTDFFLNNRTRAIYRATQ